MTRTRLLLLAGLWSIVAAPTVAAAQGQAAPAAAGLTSRRTTAVTYEARRTTSVNEKQEITIVRTKLDRVVSA